ncbi:MAG: SRPBCC family protein [Sporichthyaceae bacterium]|nr:SRPBCC family protein [Sporichthyaceae bacterium]
MRSEYVFTIPIPVDQAWALLADADRVCGWVPGARVTSAGAEACEGTLKLRARSTSATYHGTAQLTSSDHAAGELAVQVEGSQLRGNGTLKAEIEVSVASANGSGSVVSITAEFAVTGPLAESGGAAIEGAVDRLLAKFASNVLGALGDGADLAEASLVPLPPVPGVDPAVPVPASPARIDDESARIQPPAFATPDRSARRAMLPTLGRAVAAAAAVAGAVAAVRRLRRH